MASVFIRCVMHFPGLEASSFLKYCKPGKDGRQAETGRDWQRQAGTGRDRHGQAETARERQRQPETGRNRQILAMTDRVR